jgi:hypothetical protein
MEENTQLDLILYDEEKGDWYFKKNISNALNESR